MDFIPYTKQCLSLEDVQSVIKSLQSDFITRGPLVDEFEKKCAKLCQAKYAVLFNSGTSALSAASYAVNINSKDTLVTSPNTFVGTIAGALQKTNRLQFVDIDLETGSPDFTDLKEPKEGRLIIFPVHYAGIAKEVKKTIPSSIIIEDACEAFGSKYLNKEPVGSCIHSDLTIFSFHPAKTICLGEGGLVTTNNFSYYERLLLYRNNGIIKKEGFDPWVYEVHDVTTNSNVTDFAAALGLSQLKRLETLLKKRRDLVKRYRNNLSKIENIKLLSSQYDSFSAHNLFPIQIDFKKLNISRKEVMHKLKENKIGVQVHFIPLYHHPYFKKNHPLNISNYPLMEEYYQKALSLPLFSSLSFEQVDFICKTLEKILCSKEASLVF